MIMLKELIDFVDASFPSIPYGEKKRAKEAIEQFEKTGETVNYLYDNLLPELSQGDVLSDIPFVFLIQTELFKNSKQRQW
ncbi:hypothetical protein [Ruminococcus sp.]|uniref:hypothetical protein n=1 Tax=Ruminococcus sp. TaxID=41978 RepID=UPI004027FF70